MFSNVFDRWEVAELSKLEAAELLGVASGRSGAGPGVREEGEAGLVDRRLGKPSGRRVPDDRAEQVERADIGALQGFTAKHFHEHLIKDHGFGWGYTGTKMFLHGRAFCLRRR